ncbi:MAG: spore maturation protein [Oscillospiraceae bacterium]|nr:spore maturation protein [Oscillospiraceae bacterium]
MTSIATYTVPMILAAVGFLFLISKKDLFNEFIQGAKDGLETLVHLLPMLIILVVGISMFRASGGLDILSNFFAPFFNFLNIPKEIIGFIIMRPFSGSSSTAMLNDIFNQYGADSFAGRAASLIFGSSDTVFYIFAVYFGAAKIKKTGYALPAALLTQLFCAFCACMIAGML